MSLGDSNKYSEFRTVQVILKLIKMKNGQPWGGCPLILNNM